MRKKRGDVCTVDTYYNGIRLIDKVELVDDIKAWQESVLVYSPYMRSNILVRIKDLKQDFATDAIIEKLQLAHKERRKKVRL
jgi:hypothetical protein